MGEKRVWRRGGKSGDEKEVSQKTEKEKEREREREKERKEKRDDSKILFLFLTQVLVRVVKVGVADRRDDASLGAPVHADLLEPLEVRGVADALADELLCF